MNRAFDDVAFRYMDTIGMQGNLAYLHRVMAEALTDELGNIRQGAANSAARAAEEAEEAMNVLRNNASMSLRNACRQQMAGLGIGVAGLGLMTWSFCNEIGLCGESKEIVAAFKKTEQRTEQLRETVQNEYHRLCKLKAAALESIVTECDVRVCDLNQYAEVCSGYFDDKRLDDLGIEQPDEVSPDEKTTQFSYDLSVALADACRHKDAGYESYQKDFERLQENFELVCNLILLNDGNDPLTALDSAYANVDNFSTTSYMLKKAYRANIKLSLEKALSLIRMYKLASYKFNKDSDGNLIKSKDGNGQELYMVNQDTIDMTDEDLYIKVWNRLSEGYTYEIEDEKGEEASKIEEKLTSIYKEFGIIPPSEEEIRETPEFKECVRYWSGLKALPEKRRQEMAMELYSSKYKKDLDEGYACKIESVDVSKYSNPLFAEIKNIPQIVGVQLEKSKYTGTYVDNYWGERTFVPLQSYIEEQDSVIKHNIQDAKPYCYPLGTYVSCVGDSYDNVDLFRAYTNYSDNQISEFFNRLNDSGRNLVEEITNAGIPISEKYANASKKRGEGGESYNGDNLYGIALSHFTKTNGGDYKALNKSYNTYTNLYYWDAKTKKDVSSGRIKVWLENENQLINKVAVLIP